MSATRALALVMLAWLAIGVMTGIAMGRRGHDRFTWTVLGATLGPLAVPLALSTQRRTGPTVGPAARAWPPESSRDPGHGRSPPGGGGLALGLDRSHPQRSGEPGRRTLLQPRGDVRPRASFSAEPKLDVEVVWPQLYLGHGDLSGGYNVPAGLNGRRAAQVRRPGGGICLAGARRQGGGREEP
jgi:hypothetical protein